ncbi:MAG: hypothetical protein ACK40G_09635 [Cytophagaceae bacterium]
MHRLFCIFLLLISIGSYSQSSYIPLNQDYYYLIERYEVLNGRMAQGFHSTIKPIQRKALMEYIDSLNVDSSRLSKSDIFNLTYMQNDSWEFSEAESSISNRPFLRHFYKRKSDFYSVHTEDFDLHVNPVIYFSGGKDFAFSRSTYTNTRGIEARGMINNKVSFYTFAADNQGRFPEYVGRWIADNDAIPGEGFKKSFKQDAGAVDFLTARGYITVNLTKNIHAQFGHDRNFIGDGYRSLILSDFATNYTFLKLNTNVWRINYMNLFTEMNAGTGNANQIFPKKYMALHHLSLRLTDNLLIGVFESEVFGQDSARRGYDINYLNPIIFYRSIEQQLGSGDNAILGINLKWNFLKHFTLYGQFVMDEFMLQEVKARRGWWGNKFAYQAGVKYFNAFGIKNMDLLAETNIVRPYTYSHSSAYTNYTHYNQPLAHPLGANFYEAIGIVRFQPAPRLLCTGKLIYAQFGSDTTTTDIGKDNMGGNINKSYIEVANNRYFGNNIGQGIPNTLLYASLTLTYQIRHNLFVDFTQVIRQLESGLESRNLNTNFSSLSLRWNIPQRLHEF